MTRNIYAGISGAFLIGLFFTIGLWANYAVTGDVLKLVSSTGTTIQATSVLFTSLFVGLSGGHYIGGSFKENEGRRAFAIGANAVLWLFLIVFIGFQIVQGSNIIEPLLYTLVLVLSSGGIFSLHRASLIEDDSKLDEYIGLFSSKGTAVIVTATLVIRTTPNPPVASAIIIIVLVVGMLLWNSYGEMLEEYWQKIDQQIEDLRTSDDEYEIKRQ